MISEPVFTGAGGRACIRFLPSSIIRRQLHSLGNGCRGYWQYRFGNGNGISSGEGNTAETAGTGSAPVLVPGSSILGIYGKKKP